MHSTPMWIEIDTNLLMAQSYIEGLNRANQSKKYQALMCAGILK